MNQIHSVRRPCTSTFFVAGLLLLLVGCGLSSGTDAVNSTPDTPPDETSPSSAPVADAAEPSSNPTETTSSDLKTSKTMSKEIATFGGGCFWCTEAVFQQIKGVEKVVSGYCNGATENPTYKQVCTGQTGHAEVIQITYDPDKVSFAKLLEVHFKTHDPTTLNQQGADRGTQYRSGIFCHTDKQKAEAEAILKKLDDSGAYNSPIVTEVVAIKKFYSAEDYHQNYYKLNAANDGYCQTVIVPKMAKFKATFSDILKGE